MALPRPEKFRRFAIVDSDVAADGSRRDPSAIGAYGEGIYRSFGFINDSAALSDVPFLDDAYTDGIEPGRGRVKSEPLGCQEVAAQVVNYSKRQLAKVQ